MKLIVDMEGLPDNICDELRRVVESPFLEMSLRIKFLETIRKNYLTQLKEKSKHKHP